MRWRRAMAVAWALVALCAGGIAQMRARLVAERDGAPPAGLLAKYPAVMTHTHNWRFADGEHRGDFEDAEEKMVAWCARLGIRAVGVGSAWDPANDAMFQRFEGADRNLYYSGKFDQKSVMQTGEIRGLMAHLNQMSAGKTYFYLDNETPKTRMGHVWWFDYDYETPAWHDYSQDRPIKVYRDDPVMEINPLNGLPQTRRDLFEIMGIQHRAGALGVFAHPTRWWMADGKFVTNIAALAGVFLEANGSLDGLAMMSDRPFNSSAQKLWISFLDTGAVVPGFAETDFFLNQVETRTGLETFRNYMHLDGAALSEEHIRDAARRGDLFASNGAFLTLAVDGVPMGSVCATAKGKKHHVRVEAYPEAGGRFSRIQLIGPHGVVLAEKRDFGGGVLEFELEGTAQAGYVLARAFGPGDDPVAAPDQVQRAAITNPVYLRPAGFHFSAVQTACVLRVPANSRWKGGTIAFLRMDGGLIRRDTVKAGEMRIELPANARILLQKAGERDWNFSIAMENDAVEKLVTYLTSGEFRNDFRHLQQGEVPAEAFHLRELRKALARFDFVLD